MNSKLFSLIKNFVFGIVLGSTVLIPGLSAGTIGVVFNVYDKFFENISFDHASLKKHINVIIPLLLGCGVGVFLFGNLMIYLLDNYKQIMYFSFMGLIAGCVPLVVDHIKIEPIRARNIIAFAAALVFMLFLTFSEGSGLDNPTLGQYGGIDPKLLLLLFAAGAISALALLIPGTSGSKVMLILGTYTISVEAITNLDFLILAVLGAGMVVGILSGIKLIKMLLNSYGPVLFSVILGLIIGAVFYLFPGFTFGIEGLLSIIFAVGFALLPYLISKRKKR